MKIRSWCARLVLLSFAAAAPSVQAAQVTLSGASFDVTFDDSLVGLFGTPTLVGSTLSWFPSGSPGFSAQTSNGIDFTNSTFALLVAAKPGHLLGGFELRESGDYLFFGSGAGVSVSGQLRATPLPGTTVLDAIDALGLGVSNSPFDFSTRSWQSQATVAFGGPVTLANVSIQNLLAAYVPSGNGFSFIEKKEVMLDIITSPVPEPGTLGLLLAGLAGLAATRRRGSPAA